MFYCNTRELVPLLIAFLGNLLHFRKCHGYVCLVFQTKNDTAPKIVAGHAQERGNRTRTRRCYSRSDRGIIDRIRRNGAVNTTGSFLASHDLGHCGICVFSTHNSSNPRNCGRGSQSATVTPHLNRSQRENKIYPPLTGGIKATSSPSCRTVGTSTNS